MKCDVFRESVTTGDPQALTPDQTAHTQTCPPCSHYWAQTRTLRQLLAIKRYETPPPQVEQAIRRAIRVAVSEANASARARPFAGLFTGLRYVAGAACLTLLGIQLFSAERLPTLQPVSWGSPPTGYNQIVAASPAPASAHADNPVFQVSSNHQTGHLEFGRHPAKLVGFEY